MSAYGPGDFNGDGDFDASDATIFDDILKEDGEKQPNSTKSGCCLLLFGLCSVVGAGWGISKHLI